LEIAYGVLAFFVILVSNFSRWTLLVVATLTLISAYVFTILIRSYRLMRINETILTEVLAQKDVEKDDEKEDEQESVDILSTVCQREETRSTNTEATDVIA
jgi:hypothetical protein